MTSNQVFKKNPCCQLDKSHWQINYIGSAECENLAYNQFLIFIFQHFMPNCLKKTFKLKFDSCLTKLLTGRQKLSIRLALVLKTSHLYRFHPFYLSISPVLWHKCQRVFLGQLHLSNACWELWLSDGQPHSVTMDNGRGHCAYWQSCKVPK